MAPIVSPIAAFCTCKARGRANRAARARAPEARASRKPELAQAARPARPVPRGDTAPLPRPGITPYPARHAGSAGSARRWWPRWAAAPGPCHPPPPASYRRARPRSATSRHARSQTHPASPRPDPVPPVWPRQTPSPDPDPHPYPMHRKTPLRRAQSGRTAGGARMFAQECTATVQSGRRSPCARVFGSGQARQHRSRKSCLRRAPVAPRSGPGGPGSGR